ncbi:unnamed protein product [Diabrotica balteata]|uniref:Uncharacterized protein n=1 Tax=Diabrotica balteata TaxID=107213 RepID=A0A9N9T3J5_DIABA|nr:unnamed protein product [Diabrotica balteata]
MTDFTLCGNLAPSLARSGTVKRAAGTNFLQKKDKDIGCSSFSEGDDSVFSSKDKTSPDQSVNSRYRRSLDSTFRRSLESISEHKTKRSFSPTCTLSTASRCSSSLESFSSEHENPIKNCINNKNDEEKPVQSPASSYLSWIESVNNEFIDTAATTEVKPTEVNEVDNKVGEWNNFWLNYNSARSRYMSSAYLSADEKIMDDISDAKSSNSTQRDLGEKPSGEYVILTLEEAHEAIKYSKKLTEIFQTALVRNDHDCENSNLEASFYSESLSRQNSSIREDNASIFTNEELKKVARERSASYIVTTQDLLKQQKEIIKPSIQSSSTSCINAILNTGVADILKRVMKRKDIMTPDDMSSMTRRSFSEWSNK